MKPAIESTEVKDILCLLVSPTHIYVTAKINGKSIHCLLDSGCERSIIARSLVSDLHLTHLHYILLAANETDLLILGDTDIHFAINRHKFVVNVSVLPAIDEFLLGSDWLFGNKGKWDFAEGTISVGDRLICAHWCTFNNVCCHIIVTEDCIVPPQHKANIPVRMSSD